MLVTVGATVGTSNLAIGVLAGLLSMALILAVCALKRRLHQKKRRQPKKNKESPVSVIAVIITLEPTAGSRPSLTITIGIITPSSPPSTG